MPAEIWGVTHSQQCGAWAFGGRYTNHEQSSSSPTVPAGLAVIVRIMQIEMVINLTPYEIGHSIEVLNAPCSITVTGCLLQVAECGLMLPPQHHLVRPQPAGSWPSSRCNVTVTRHRGWVGHSTCSCDMQRQTQHSLCLTMYYVPRWMAAMAITHLCVLYTCRDAPRAISARSSDP